MRKLEASTIYDDLRDKYFDSSSEKVPTGILTHELDNEGMLNEANLEVQNICEAIKQSVGERMTSSPTTDSILMHLTLIEVEVIHFHCTDGKTLV